jgi:uncharacterized protein YjbI with pentapeptide repeats
MDDAKRLTRLKGYYFAGRNYERADLRNKDLKGINFTCSNFRGADLTGSDLTGATFVMCDLSRACLHNCKAEGADFSGADLTGAYCKGVAFTKAILWHTCFKGAILKNATFFDAEMVGADLCRAECLGARFDGADVTGVRNVDRAIFRWFLNPELSGKPTYDAYPGATLLSESALGTISLQENAGLGQTGLEYDRER